MQQFDRRRVARPARAAPNMYTASDCFISAGGFGGLITPPCSDELIPHRCAFLLRHAKSRNLDLRRRGDVVK